jgi:hypothetical protein
LEHPVGDRAGVAMRLLDVGLGNYQKALDHLQGGMATHTLQSKDGAAFAQKLGAEGVAEAADGDTRDACPFPGRFE